METRKRKRQSIIMIFTLLGLLVLIGVKALGLNRSLEYKIYDIFLRFKPARSSAQNLIYIRVNETVKAEGLWPWGENWLAYLVNFLSGLGVKAIGIDPSLTNFISKDGNQYLLNAAESRSALFYQKELDFPEAADKDLIIDNDNKVRRFALINDDSGKPAASLVLKLGYAYRGNAKNSITFIKGKEIGLFDAVQKNKLYIPLISEGETLIDYSNKLKDSIKEYSYFDVVMSAFLISRRESPSINFSEFENKICFIAYSPDVLNKSYSTPIGTALSAPQIRLIVLGNIIDGNFIRKLNLRDNILLLLFTIAVCSLIFIRLNLLKRIFGLVILVVIYMATSFSLFSLLGLWIDTFLPVVAILFAFSGISIYRHSQELEIKLQERRIELARRLKAESLSKNSLSTDSFDAVIKKNSPREAGGDFYDIIELDAERFAFIIGNSPGKNLKTVNYIIKTLNEFRLQAPLHKRHRAILNAVNNALFPDGAGGMYATCIYFEIDAARGTLSFANAGEEPFILSRQSNPDLEIYEAPNPTPLGVAKNIRFTDQTIAFNKGSLIVAFTRNLVELKDRQGIEFGIDRLKEIISQYRSWDISKLANKIFEKIHRFSEGQDLNRECSLLLVRAKREFSG